jgi:hypothetical protein
MKAPHALEGVNGTASWSLTGRCMNRPVWLGVYRIWIWNGPGIDLNARTTTEYRIERRIDLRGL